MLSGFKDAQQHQAVTSLGKIDCVAHKFRHRLRTQEYKTYATHPRLNTSSLESPMSQTAMSKDVLGSVHTRKGSRFACMNPHFRRHYDIYLTISLIHIFWQCLHMKMWPTWLKGRRQIRA